MIDLTMLSCNRARITELTIRELSRRTLSPYRLIVLDNGSVDGSPEMLKELRAEGLIHELHFLKENTGVHFGFNYLLDLVRSDPYICTDNDLIPQAPFAGEDWLTRLLRLGSLYPEYAAIACRPHILIGEPQDRFDRSPEIREMSHIGAHLRLFKTKIVRQVGGWKNEKSPSRNNEDWHICGLLKRAGYKVGYSRDVRCLHLWGQGPETENRTEDEWGYPLDIEHGHRPVWPPVTDYGWQRLGIDWETCR